MLLVSANQTDTTFDPGTFDYHTLYLWKVVATDNHGSSVNSSIWSFWTEWEPIPDNPSELTADTVSDTQINLYWIDNSDNELGFKIERKLEVSDSYTPVSYTHLRAHET